MAESSSAANFLQPPPLLHWPELADRASRIATTAQMIPTLTGGTLYWNGAMPPPLLPLTFATSTIPIPLPPSLAGEPPSSRKRQRDESESPSEEGVPLHYHCTECEIDFPPSEKGDFIDHMKMKHRPPYSCWMPDCESTLIDVKGLLTHFDRLHGSDHKAHRCGRCHFQTDGKTTLFRHLAVMHPTREENFFFREDESRSKIENGRTIHYYNVYLHVSPEEVRSLPLTPMGSDFDREESSGLPPNKRVRVEPPAISEYKCLRCKPQTVFTDAKQFYMHWRTEPNHSHQRVQCWYPDCKLDYKTPREAVIHHKRNHTSLSSRFRCGFTNKEGNPCWYTSYAANLIKRHFAQVHLDIKGHDKCGMKAPAQTLVERDGYYLCTYALPKQ